MKLSILAALVAAVASVAASPIPDTLLPRSCSAMGSTTIGGQKVKGPFKLQAKGDFSKSGNYAQAGTQGKVKFDVGGPRKSEATDFYLTAAGNLISRVNGITYDIFEPNPTASASTNVQVGRGGTPKLVCNFNSGSCALTCKVNGFGYNCLSSAGFVPDWRITKEKAGSGPGCIPFTSMVVPS